MEQERWQRAEAIFHAALEQEPAARRSYLAEACEGDEALRRDVELLLSKDQGAGGFLDTPALADVPAWNGRSRAPLVGLEIGPYRVDA
jgi:serine/threonine-protein kinase